MDKKEMVKVKFNAYVTPKVAFNAKTNKFEPVAKSQDFRTDVLKLMTEQGSTPEETQRLKDAQTSMLIRNRLMSIEEALTFLYGSVNDAEVSQFYYRDQIIELPKQLADYYTNLPVGGKNIKGEQYLKNIDDKQQIYSENEMARFKREHQPIMSAEIFNG